MIDLETLSTSTDAAILTIGAVKFNPNGNELVDNSMEEFYVKVDLDSCSRLGLSIDDNTIAWWASQSKEAQDAAFSEDGRIDIVDAFNQLYKFCWGSKRVWSHGAAFDIVICETVFKKINKLVPWEVWQVRCSRTLFDLGVDPSRPATLKHHALEDARNQAIGVQNIFRELARTQKDF
jgi:DNA polymerase III epsilon subunit-like protein